MNCKDCEINCSDKRHCQKAKGCLDSDDHPGLIITHSRGWYINQCGLCGKYNKTPIKKDFFSTEYICDFKLPHNPTDYRCYTRCLHIVFVLRRNTRDIDNLPKVFIDCLQKRYGFNDKEIEVLTLEKRVDKTRKREAIMFEFAAKRNEGGK